MNKSKQLTLEEIENKLIYVSLSSDQRDYVVNLLVMAHELGYLSGIQTAYNKAKEVYGR